MKTEPSETRSGLGAPLKPRVLPEVAAQETTRGLKRWARSPGRDMNPYGPGAKGYWLIFGLAAFLVAGAIGGHIRSEYQKAWQEWNEQLSSLADDRAAMVSDWLHERQADAITFASRPSVIALLSHSHNAPAPRQFSPGGINEHIDQVVKAYDYNAIYILDPKGKVALESTGAPGLDASTLGLYRIITHSGKYRVDLLGDSPATSRVSFCAPVLQPALPAAPTLSTPIVLGAVVLVMDSPHHLFPLLNTMSVTTRSGETILAYRDVNDLVYFTPLRKVPPGAANIRKPYQLAMRAPRAAIEGRQVFGEFTDYSGARILAATRRIAPTGWGLVSKLDRAEALEGFRRMAWFEATAGAMIVLALGGLLFVHRRYAVTSVLNAEAEKFRGLLESAPDAMVIVNPQGQIVLVNAQAEKLFGFDRQEMLGRPLMMLVPERFRAERSKFYAQYFSQVLSRVVPAQEGRWGLRRDGSEFPAQITRSPIKTPDGPVVAIAVRDITEQLRSEQELRLSQERLALALRAGHSGGFDWDIQKNINYWSPEIEALYGVEEGQFGGSYEAWEHLVLPEDLEIARANIQQAMKSGEFNGEWRARRHCDGEIRWLAAHARVYFDEGGRPSRMIGINTDVTDRKRAEEALHESEAEFRVLAESVPQLVWMCSPDGLNVYFNQRWVDYTGLALQESYGRGWNTPFHPDDKQLAWRAWNHAVETGDTYSIECRLRRADGAYRWFLIRGEPMLGDTGGITKWFGTCTDIDDLKRAELQLATQAKIAQVFLTVPDDEMYHEVLKVILGVMHSEFGVFGFIDENGANVVPSMTRHIGDKRQVPEKRFVFPRSTWGEGSWVRALLEKKANFFNEICTTTLQGQVEIRRHISLPILFQGESIGLLQVANGPADYTETDVHTLESVAESVAPILKARLERDRQESKRVQAEAEIVRINEGLELRVRQRTAELEAANNELEAFTYSVSHDLRAPLRHIDGFSKMLQEEDSTGLTEDSKRYLGRIREGTRQMGQLVDDLLNLARVGRREISLQVAGLSSLAEEVVAQLKHENPNRAIEWSVDVLPFVECDPSLLRQVFANLL